MKNDVKMFSFVLVLLLFAGSAAAQDLDSQIVAMAKETEGQILDGALGKLFGNQRINIYIDLEDESQLIVGLITEGKVVKKLQAGAVEDPTLNIYTDQATVAEIQTSSTPGRVLTEAFDDGRISYKAIGIFNKLKFKTIFVFVNIINSWTGDGDKEDNEQDKKVVKKKQPKDEETNTDHSGDSTTEIAVNVSAQASPEPASAASTAHTVEMTNDGFGVEEMAINAGETVEWKNVRTGSFKTAMVIGTQKCSQVKSPILNAGETYSYIFDEAMTCTIVDGILTTTSMQLAVE